MGGNGGELKLASEKLLNPFFGVALEGREKYGKRKVRKAQGGRRATKLE